MFVNQPLDEVARLPPTRSGSRTCSCTATRARRSAPRSRSAPAPKVIKARADRATPPTCATSTRFHTDLHLLDTARARPARRHGPDLGLGAARAAALQGPADPAAGGLTPENVGEAIAAVRPVGGRRGSGVEASPGRQGPGEGSRRSSRRSTPARVGMSVVEHRFGPYGGQYVPGDADAGARRARGGVDRRARRRRLPAPSSTRCCATTSAARRRCTSPQRLSEARRPRRLPQARGPQPHRRAQDQQRARPGAAGPAHGQDAHHRRDRRGPARRRHRHRLRAARPRVRRLHGHRGHAPPAAQRRSGWGCWARPSRRSTPARARSRRRSRRRSATGSPTSATRTT